MAQLRKREEEGRLAKIPSPMEKYNVAIKRRDETRRDGNKKKETPCRGQPALLPYGLSGPQRGPYRNLAWKATKTWLVK